MRRTDFLASCQSICLDGGTTAPLCTTYYQCSLQGIETNDLWMRFIPACLGAGVFILDASNRQCFALIYPELVSRNSAVLAPPGNHCLRFFAQILS
ncbi:MAG: hypothetical protein MO852_03475 [Candidatus Devosia euplotis]|nr:hypothetical protein [Candidatus Devosia euplotis]